MTDSPRSRAAHAGWFIAAFLVVFGFLPIVNWIPGGREAPWYGTVASGWLSGGAIVIGAGAIAAILGRRVTWSASWWTRIAEVARKHPVRAGAVLGALAFLVYACIAWFVFDGTPLHLDEIAQVIQARIFAQGRLYLEAPAHPEFQSALHVLDMDGKWYAQFPPGGPLLLVPGVWLGAPWLVGPALGGASVALFWGIVRRAGVSAGVSLGSTLVFAASPFVAFMAASHMNHVGTLCLALLVWWAAVRHAEHASLSMAVLLGLATGTGATIRPVDALAVALPVGAWVAWRLVRGAERWAHAFAMLCGVAIPVGMLLWYNQATTGDPFLFAYERLWGAEHGLGFHASPWGLPHTPATGVELISLYFLRLQTYLFETPLPSLLFVVVGAALSWKPSGIERYWLGTGALVCVLYLLYWHDGFYLGPRFLFLLAPACAWFAAQAPGALLRRVPGARGFVAGATMASVALAMVSVGSDRGKQYAAGLQPLRAKVTDHAAAAGVENAVVLVRETWGSQLMARLWAVGVSRSQAEWIYRSADACALDEALIARELGNAGAVTDWSVIVADSARLVPSPWSPDQSERALPGRAYSELCQRRVLEDRAGTFIYVGLLAREWGSNVYLKDLHALNRRHPAMADLSRPWYLLRSADGNAGSPPVFIPVNKDSALAEWGALLQGPSAAR